MGTTTQPDSAALLAELNDLLQLDRDAVQAYTLAEQALESETYRTAIRRFKADHQQHIDALTALVVARGGTPAATPHLSSSPFKLAAQGLGDLGSDTSVLLAFKANERLSRDKYQRAAGQGYPPDVQAAVQRGAADETAHYDWVQGALERLGAGSQTAAGKAEAAVEAGHARVADAMEAGEKRLAQGARAVRDRLSAAAGGASGRAGDLSGQLAAGGIRNVWIALGVGLVAAQLVGRRGPRRGTSGGRYPTSTASLGPTRSYAAQNQDSFDTGLPAL